MEYYDYRQEIKTPQVDPKPNFCSYLDQLPLATAVVKNQQYKGILPLDEAFIRGSAFEDLYLPYPPKQLRNERIAILDTEQNALLKAIGEHTFACLDLQLFLDTHPNCKEALEDYNRLSMNLQRATKEFEEKYYPLSNFGESLSQYPWQWNNSPWPWEQGGGK